MNRCSWGLLALLALVLGCSSASTGADTRRYACTLDDECAAGFTCRAGFCQGAGGEPGDGGPDPGTPSGSPTRLAFVSPEQSVGTGQCSAAVVIETQTAEGLAAPVQNAATVSLSVEPSQAVSFFLDAACTSATSSVEVGAGSSRATFYFRGGVAQTIRVGVSASGLTSATQDEVLLVPGPAVGVVFVTGAQTLATNGCSSLVELEARDANGTPTTFSNSRGMTVVGTGLTFFSDESCTTPLSSAMFAAGRTRSSFYFKGKSSGTIRLFVSVSGLSTVFQDETILPVVRSGVCTIPANGYSVTCPISPAQVDMSKTLLLISLSNSGRSPDSGSLRCMLSARDAFTCGRNAIASSNFDIVWQTVELGTGLRVQHLQPSCQGAPLISVPIAAVSPQKSFLLVSGEQSGAILGEDDVYTATLASSGNRVDLQFSTNCSPSWKGSLQVVELEGIQVLRGGGAMAGGQTWAGSTSLAFADPATTALLFTYRVNNAGAVNLCDRVLRGEVTSSTELAFSRALEDSPNCDTAGIEAISWERINFGSVAKVQSVPVSMSGGQTQATPNIQAVERTRAVVFASGQAMNGQAGGEASYSGDDILGESLARFEFSPTLAQLRVRRESSLGAARWNAFVVEFNP
ncbi:hypothetical protein CYFUS_003861 [Cystobacter fuscus]|uniref:Lipoprotein n=1 Tax=Cystobacter fuscus TaxID=43 RepID=A0A250J5H0_9BACT|nr:hypothetical protein [Cystobacter fuscus]ATB38426.1 hypothetical protein CYFUS_003861 [Cystobacter fuscus]